MISLCMPQNTGSVAKCSDFEPIVSILVLQGSSFFALWPVPFVPMYQSQPVAEVLAYLHVQISPISCSVVRLILLALWKNTEKQLKATGERGWGDTTPCTVNWCKKVWGDWLASSYCRGRMDDLSFFNYLSTFCFLLNEFHCSFSISYKILPDYVYYYCISIRMW